MSFVHERNHHRDDDDDDEHPNICAPTLFMNSIVVAHDLRNYLIHTPTRTHYYTFAFHVLPCL